MKTFLTLCTCAMVSAGIYGFADMAHDVNNGTMIQYDRGETPSSVTAAMLRSGMHYTANAKNVKPIHFNFNNAVSKVEVKTPVTPAPTDFSFSKFTADYSRSIPVEYMQEPVTDVSTVLSASTVVTDAPEIKTPEKAPVTETSVATDTTSAQPEITATTDVKTDSSAQLKVPDEEFTYRDFSRGSPRKYKKKKN